MTGARPQTHILSLRTLLCMLTDMAASTVRPGAASWHASGSRGADASAVRRHRIRRLCGNTGSARRTIANWGRLPSVCMCVTGALACTGYGGECKHRLRATAIAPPPRLAVLPPLITAPSCAPVAPPRHIIVHSSRRVVLSYAHAYICGPSTSYHRTFVPTRRAVVCTCLYLSICPLVPTDRKSVV